MAENRSSPAGYLPPPAALDSRERQLNPFSWFGEMRREAPLRYDDSRGCWEVFTYREVKEAFADWETFSSRAPMPADRQNIMRDTIFNVDPPRHTKLRSTVTDAFRPEAIAPLEPKIRSTAETLLEDAADDGRMDFVADFAQPLPILVIAELLGIPDEDLEQFRTWCDILTKDQSTIGSDAVKEQQRVGMEMADYFTTIIERRREEPKDDLISELAQSELDGEPMPVSDILGFGALLLIAGNITTAHAITNALRCFSNHDLLTELAGDEARIETAMEEVYRYRPPVPIHRRVVTEDTEFAGENLRKGDLVMLWTISANRDEDRFDDTETFDPDRDPNPHITFGHGIHACLGSALARLEGRVALSTFLDMFDEITVVETDPDPVWNTAAHGVKSLEVEITR